MLKATVKRFFITAKKKANIKLRAGTVPIKYNTELKQLQILLIGAFTESGWVFPSYNLIYSIHIGGHIEKDQTPLTAAIAETVMKCWHYF